MAQQRSAFLDLWVDGVRMEDAMGRVLRLEVDERADDASSFHLSLDMAPTDAGDWDALADGRFGLLHRVTIGFGVGEPDATAPAVREVVFDGYITAVEPVFGPSRVPDSSLELYGLDASCLMHLEERTRSFSGLTDAAIVRQIYGEYGFGLDVQETAPVRDETRGMVLQRGTDAELIRMLARRQGYEAYVERASAPVGTGSGATREMVGHFHLSRADAAPQPELALMPAATPSLISLRARWESHRPTEVRGAHVDERTRRIRSATVASSRLKKLGATTRADILKARMAAVLPKRPKTTGVGLQVAEVPHDTPEVENLAWSDFRDADWLAEASGVVQGQRYPRILRSRRPVGVKGAGKLMDGVWYVRNARHRWVWDEAQPRYEVDVDLARNALNGVG
jgi:phage protein D